jgi:Mrp family chromosome partitioning ATPase
MSHLFDALQRSEFEHPGIDLSTLSATWLLQFSQHQTIAEPATQFPFAFPAVPPPATAADSHVATEHPQNDDRLDPFAKFQSLQVLAPPQSRLVCLTDEESLAAEKFHFLGVRLRQLRQNRILKKVLITSAVAREGKSTVAANLACTLARRTQQRILLLEGDLRASALTQMFGVGKIPGLCEWLYSQEDFLRSWIS